MFVILIDTVGSPQRFHMQAIDCSSVFYVTDLNQLTLHKFKLLWDNAFVLFENVFLSLVNNIPELAYS